jgi:predicted AAA+ superfamily ATPase
MDDPNKLSMFRNREEIRELKEVIDALIKRVHRLELKTGVLKKPRNPWMGDPLPRR